MIETAIIDRETFEAVLAEVREADREALDILALR